MKILIAILAVLIGAAAIVYLIGYMLPAKHVASADILISAPPGKVAALIRDVESQAGWRSGVKCIEIIERSGDILRYREYGDGNILFDLREPEAGRRFVSEIADPELPFGGTWQIEIIPESTSTRTTVTENGVVWDPLFRFFSAVIFGHDTTMKKYLGDLKRAAERG